jgi:hypothetical protein
MDFSTVIGGTSTNFFGTFPSATNISLAVNSLGQAYLAGAAFDGFPTTPQAYQPSYVGKGQTNAFLGLLNAGGTALRYGTYLGGTGGDSASQLALDSPGNVYVTGTTASLDFPTTPGAFQTTNLENGQAAFVTKMDSGLSTLVYSTYLGATQSNFGSVHATAIAVDASGNSYVVGYTDAQSFPLVSPIVTTIAQSFGFRSAESAFLSVLNSSGSALTFSTFFTGSVGTSGTGVALDSSGNPYITGTTLDPDLPTTAGAFQATIPPPPNPVQHAFVTKFSLSTPSAGACLSASALNFGTVEPGKSSFPYPVTLTNCGTVVLKITSMAVSNPVFVMSGNNCKNLTASASCTFNLRYSPTVAGIDTATLQINDNAPITPQKIQLSGYSALSYLQIYTSVLNAPDEIVRATTALFLAQVSNADGVLPIHITSVTATGDFAGVNQCPNVLYPGQISNLGATFTPSATGTRSGTLSIFDDAVGSPQTPPLTGNGLGSYPTPVIAYMSPDSALVGSTQVRVVLQGTGFFPTSTVTVNGRAITARSSYPEKLEITLYGLNQVRNLSIQVTNPAPGGASAAVGFSVYSQTALGAADVIYEPYTQKFYASIPAASASNPNTLETIDPVTGLIGPPIAIGNDPGALGLSSDGTMLYVGLNGDHAVIPFNLRTQKAGSEIPLGSDSQKGPLTASTLQVQPNNSANFIATLNAGYNGADGIDWIKNGVVVSQFLNEPPNNIALGGTRFVDPADVYGWQSAYNAPGIDHFEITAKGLLEAPGIAGAFGLGAFDTDGVNLYDVNGQIFNAASGALVGTFFCCNSEAGVYTDTSSGRTFFLGQYDGVLLAFDSATFAQVGSITFSFFNNPPSRLQHWSADGLSYFTYNSSTGGYDLVLFRTNLFYPSLGPNPLPLAKSTNPSQVNSKGPNFLLTLNGSQFIQGATVRWNGSDRTTRWVSSTQLIADIPASDIASPGTARVTVLNPPPGGGKSGTVLLRIK